MGISDWVAEQVDEFLDAGGAALDGMASAAAGIGEGALAEAGGHLYVAGAEKIAQQNKPGQPLDEYYKLELRELFGPLVDQVRVTFGATLIELKLGVYSVTESHGQTFGHNIYIEREKLGPKHSDYEDQLELLAHELTHSRQYDDAGGSLLLFGNRYFRSFGRAGFVYRMNPMEIEARAFAACFMKRREKLASLATLHRETWTRGWTHFVPLVIGGKPHALAYQTESGLAALDEIGPLQQLAPGQSAVRTLWREKWTPGWTSIVPYFDLKPVAGARPPTALPVTRLLSYKAASGEVAIDEIQGTKLASVSRGNWTPGWTHMFAFDVPGTGSFLFSYKAGTGEAAIDQLKGNLADIGRQNRFRAAAGSFARDWTAFVPFELNDQPHYLGYKGVTGEFIIHRIKPGLDGIEERLRGKLMPGTSTLMACQVGSVPHFLMYRAATGGVGIFRTPQRPMVEKVWCHKWTKGWSSFMPFQLDGKTHYLAYKKETGEAAFDRLSGPAAPKPR